MNLSKKLTHTLIPYFVLGFLLLVHCSSAPRYTSGDVKKISNKKISKSPRLNTKSSFNKHRKTMKGVSSFYAEDFHGKLTANG